MARPVVNPYLLLRERSVDIASARPTMTRTVQTIMIAPNPSTRYNGVRRSGDIAYPVNRALLKTDDDVPLRVGYDLTTIVSNEAHMKLVPTPNTDMNARNS